ncbi:hypothetical protein GCM10020000_70490 [Streptomyces olivoverticillatus]
MPVLVLQLGMVLINMPQLLVADWQRIGLLIDSAGASGSHLLGTVAACLQILLLTLPIAGLTLASARPVRALVRLAFRRGAKNPPTRRCDHGSR